MKRIIFLAALAMAGLASPRAHGQQLISLAMSGSDITPDGQTLVGALYEADIEQGIYYTWTRAGGAVRMGIQQVESFVRLSSDASVMGYVGYNSENMGGLTYGHPQDYQITELTRRWTQATGSVNLGVMTGGNRCDYTINTPSGMSYNGRFFVGGGWTAGLCGPYRAWIYDYTTQAFTRMPITISPPPASSPSSATAAWGVSENGDVVIGYDQNFTTGGFGSQRLATVWTKSGSTWTATHLDANGGQLGCVSADGNVIFGVLSSYTMNQVFGTTTTSVVRWVRSGATWTPTNLGGGIYSPLRTNHDGSIMIGEQCFWRADVNGGQPMDLTDYLATQGVMLDNMTISNPFGPAVRAMSDDGSKITFQVYEDHGGCLGTYQVMMADLTNTACIAPRVNFNPISQVITNPTNAGNPYGAIFNVFISGAWPLNYQWQKESSPGVWTNLTDDNCFLYNADDFDIKGSDTPQLRVGFLDGVWQGNYRCVISGECGSTTSAVATLSAPSTCGTADFNCDGDVGTDSDIESFFACLAGNCPAAPCTSTADFNGDGDVGTDADIEAFFRVLAGGTC